MKKALLIGIDNYPNGSQLKGCVNDVLLLNSVIERNGDGKKNFDVKLMTNEQSSDDALDAIRDLFGGDNDTSLLYFSGHGFANDIDAELVFPNNISARGIANTGISMGSILKLANNSKVHNKIIILDCCHSGNMGSSDPMGECSHLSSGVSILTACRDYEVAVEKDGHGVFTKLLCGALEGAAADFTGNITIGGVYAYIDRSFGAWEQRPVFKTNVTEFAPLKTVTPKVSLNTLRELPNLFIEADKDFSLDPSFEDTNSQDVKHEIKQPYADSSNVKLFKILQQLQSIGFVEPVGTDYMYFAAMESKSCRLTALGQHYWQLVKDNKI